MYFYVDMKGWEDKGLKRKEVLDAYEKLKEESYRMAKDFSHTKSQKPVALPIGVNHIIHELEQGSKAQLELNDRALVLISRLLNEGVEE